MTNDVYEDVKPKKIKPVTAPDGTEMARPHPCRHRSPAAPPP